MAAYMLFDNLEVRDPALLARYKELAAPVVARYGGRYIVLGGPCEVREGSWSPTFPVMIEFPSAAAARAWYESEEYRPILALRLAAVRSSAVLIDGFPSAAPAA